MAKFDLKLCLEDEIPNIEYRAMINFFNIPEKEDGEYYEFNDAEYDKFFKEFPQWAKLLEILHCIADI